MPVFGRFLSWSLSKLIILLFELIIPLSKLIVIMRLFTVMRLTFIVIFLILLT